MARILVISDVPPALSFPNGYSARFLHFLRALSRDHLVDLLALVGPSMGDHFRHIDGLSGSIHPVEIGTSPLMEPTLVGRALRARHYIHDRLPFMSHPRSIPELPSILANTAPQLVLLYLPHLSHLAESVPRGIPVICVLEEGWERAMPVSTNELGGLRRQLVLATERRRVHRIYRRAGQRSAGIVLISDEERQQFEDLIPAEKLAVFPHGVDCQFFSPRPSATADETFDIAVVCDFLQTRNTRGLQAVVSGLRAPGSDGFLGRRWILVGRGSTEALTAIDQPEAVPSVGHFEATGPVPDVRDYYGRAKVVLVPDLEGTGVKTTVLQAWAMGKPVVVTRAATRGLPVSLGTDVLVGDTPSDLLQQIHNLLEDPALREKVAHAGRRSVTAHRDIHAIAEGFAAYCGRAANDHAA
jgi:glycosyltransferase involved in cell wall biosynthesis